MKTYTLVLTVLEHGDNGQVARHAATTRHVDDAQGESGTPATLAGHAAKMAHAVAERLVEASK